MEVLLSSATRFPGPVRRIQSLSRRRVRVMCSMSRLARVLASVYDGESTFLAADYKGDLTLNPLIAPSAA